MPDEPHSGLPTFAPRTLDRAALERVLARAAELQASRTDPSESMTGAELLELGKEVGLAPEHLRQALAEEQTRVVVPAGEGRVGAVFGPAGATASRVVRGTPASVLAMLDQWMQKEECLQVKRRFTDRMTWESRRDLVGNIKRGFNVGGRGYALTRAGEVGATVVAVDEQRVLVRLDADLADARRRSVSVGSIVAGGGIVSAGGVVALAALMPGGSILAAALIGGTWAVIGGAGFAGVARSHRRTIERAQLALEQVLDRLEHGDLRSKGSLLDVLTTASRRGP